MSNLQRRIKLSIKIFQELKSIIKDENNFQINNSLESLNHYLEVGFKDFTEEEKQSLSILMLNDAVSISKDILEQASLKEITDYKYMTMQEVKNKLFNEYTESLKVGNEEVASLNLSDWLDRNGIKIIEQSSSTNS